MADISDINLVTGMDQLAACYATDTDNHGELTTAPVLISAPAQRTKC
ncbi:hypothetical protein T08_15399 [Trichinella sp. T8]|nr:hypothetical protein T08_15399 [Trichinella sp. T8]